MYLRSIRMRNLKLIRDLKLDFSRDGEPRMWTVLLAENGHCKTAILQAIALAASGETRANQLADVPSLPDRRSAQAESWVEADFAVAPMAPGAQQLPWAPDREIVGLRSILGVRPGSSVIVGRSWYLDKQGPALPKTALSSFHPDLSQQPVDPLREVRAQNLPNWFVVAYGTGRALPDPETSPVPTDPARNRMASLFGPAPLVGTDFVSHLRNHDAALGEPFVRALMGALFTEPDLLPAVKHLELRGEGGVETPRDLIQAHRFTFLAGGEHVAVPATSLSLGYQSTIAWVADLVGQAFWDGKRAVELAEMTGLVLIDELDLHLHPRWQVNMVRTLKRVFPKMQFIVTTHSPMLLPGLEADEVIRLGMDEEGNVIQLPEGPSPRLMTGTDLYSRYFGVTDLYPDHLGKALMRYGTLAGDPGRSHVEDAELVRLRDVLVHAGVDPGWEPVPVDPDLRREDVL